MTEIEKKAEEYLKNNIGVLDNHNLYPSNNEKLLKQSYIDGYEQGQTDFDETVTKLLNSYGVTFIDTNSLGGLVGLHQIILDIEKENEELKEQIEKMKCCDNCIHCHRQYEDINCDFKNQYDDVICSRGYNGKIDGWELAE